MKHVQGSVPLFVFCAVMVLASCAAAPEHFEDRAPDDFEEIHDWFLAEHPLPSGIAFVPAEFPSLKVSPGVGAVTMDGRDRAAALSEGAREELSASFRAAYINSLFREAPLAGVLGGDFVHGWPSGDPYAWVQNWRSSVPQNNSWGIPSLVLAVRGFREAGEAGRVFVVQGKLLDHYGKSGGINGANGIVGYGSPRGYEFLLDGKLAQRFDFGLITTDGQGRTAFFPEEPPSLALDVPPLVGVFPGASGNVRPAFVMAWKMALDRGIERMSPDGPGLSLALSDEVFRERLRDFPGGETLEGLYVQTFNGRTALLVLSDAPGLPPYPRFIGYPFLDALLAVSGDSRQDDFSRALMTGFALYGIPLADPVPLPGGEDGPLVWREAQRFSRGWMLAPIQEGAPE